MRLVPGGGKRFFKVDGERKLSLAEYTLPRMKRIDWKGKGLHWKGKRERKKERKKGGKRERRKERRKERGKEGRGEEGKKEKKQGQNEIGKEK